MGTILAFAGSNSSTSINFQLVRYSASFIEEHKVKSMNMANYPFPMYSEDYEKENGYSNSLIEVKNEIQNADGLDRDFIKDKKILLMSTSPGKRGAIGAHEVVKSMFTRFGAATIIGFSLPSFHQNFEDRKGITDSELAKNHQEALKKFLAEI